MSRAWQVDEVRWAKLRGNQGKVTRSGSRSKEECVVSLACCVVVGSAQRGE